LISAYAAPVCQTNDGQPSLVRGKIGDIRSTLKSGRDGNSGMTATPGR
jgi:hypothetical protein